MLRAVGPWLVAVSMAASALTVARGSAPEATAGSTVRARAAQVAVDGVPATPTPPPQTARVVVRSGATSASLDVEIARTEAEREFGLMNRTSLPDDGGMLFLFPFEGAGGFWMKDTLIPLDIAFVSSDLRIVTIRHGLPLDLTVLSPTALYRYAIETNVGWFPTHGFDVGATVELPPGLPAAE